MSVEEICQVSGTRRLIPVSGKWWQLYSTVVIAHNRVQPSSIS